VERLAEQPSLSIPAACIGTAETKAAYRLLSHEAVGWSDILAPHLKNSVQRMAPSRWCCACRTRRSWTSTGRALRDWGR
jgi:hypothetical protein